MSIDDEVSVQENDQLVPAKVVNVSNFSVQGSYHQHTIFVSDTSLEIATLPMYNIQ